MYVQQFICIRYVLALAYSCCRFAPAYYDWVYALMPSGRRNKRAIELVHKFSMDVIKARRATLENRKVQKMFLTVPSICTKRQLATSQFNQLHGNFALLFTLSTHFQFERLMLMLLLTTLENRRECCTKCRGKAAEVYGLH